MDDQFARLFDTSRECFVDPHDVDAGRPLLADDWLSPEELDTLRLQREARLRQLIPSFSSPPCPLVTDGVSPLPSSSHDNRDVVPSPVTSDTIHPTVPLPKPSPPSSDLAPPPQSLPPPTALPPPTPSKTPSPAPVSQPRYPTRVRGGTWKDGPALDRRHPATKGQWKTGLLSSLLSMPQYALASVSSWAQPPARVSNVGSRHGPVYSSIKVRHDHLHQLSLLQDDWSDVGVTITSGLSSEFASYFSPDLADDAAALTVEALHPCALKAKAAKSDADNPTWSQAMNSPDSDKWFAAMEEELTTLKRDLAAWDLVPREPWMHVLPSTWAFCIKRFPNGLVKKFKARFCVRGDCQKEGIDFWETWSPVVQQKGSSVLMSPVILLPAVSLSLRLGLRNALLKRWDYAAAPPRLSAHPDSEGDLASGAFNYAAVVGMLLYLSGHSHPDIAFAVHQCARYTFRPTQKHELALIRIGRYLKGTMDKGLILSPSDEARIDCFPDADFAGLYGHEDSQDPHCARSRTGFVILAFGCPVLWKSRLQTEIALSTMEAEYVALSTACKDLFPIVDMVKSLCLAVGLSCASVAQLHIKIHEDNVGARTLAGLEPRRMNLWSKHYAIKYHWFHEHVAARHVQLVKVNTHNQLVSIDSVSGHCSYIP
eukprot:CCRYP_019381-RA/>CCRYP_019381-RA protein AED:0.27 eAED:0.27 QI:0/0/0/0.66/0.5/0.33/3/0/652